MQNSRVEINHYINKAAHKWKALLIGQKRFVIIMGALLNFLLMAAFYAGINAGAYLASKAYSTSMTVNLPPLECTAITAQAIWIVSLLYISYKARN